MKIVFVSNYFNHHQRPFCEALLSGCDSFFFIATDEMREERRKLGYAFEEPGYVLRAFGGDGLERAKQLIASADVLIHGGVVGELSKPRYYRGKTVFYYSERLYKHGCKRWQLPLRAIRFYFRYLWRQNALLLCASAYAAYDYSRTLTFSGRRFRWGYFPETKRYEIKKLMAEKDEKKILWCGRLIDWKHPELAVETAARLRDANVDFTMDIIGSGNMEEILRKQIQNCGLADRVSLLGSMPPSKTREYMERAGIMLLTSDRKEGWGAVLNEAMNSGCAVVASSAAGSAPFLLEDGENGFTFRSGDAGELFEKTQALLTQPTLAARFGVAAYETVSTLWNAETAGQRFLQFAECFSASKTVPAPYENGPLSAAPLMKDR